MYSKTAATVALALLASSAVAQLNDSSVDIGAIDIGTKSMLHPTYNLLPFDGSSVFPR